VIGRNDFILGQSIAKPVVGVGFRVIDRDQPIGGIVDIGIHSIAQQISVVVECVIDSVHAG
jgi:hypothetical protein